MELKTFTHIEDEGGDWEYQETIGVLYVPRSSDGYTSEVYILNADVPGHSFAIYPGMIPYYIEVLEWMRDHQASLPQTDRTDGGEELPQVDSPGAREEEG